MQGPHWFRRLLAGVTVEEVQRFDAAFDGGTSALERRRGSEGQPWCEAADQDLANATRHRTAYKLEAAWSALKSCHREMVKSFTCAELVAEARTIRNEADQKLAGWRQDSVEDLLPDELIDRVALGGGGFTVERRVRIGSPSIDTSSTTDDDARAQAAGATAEPDGVERSAPETDGCERDDSVPVGDQRALVADLRTRLIKAKELVDESSDNVYHKFRILRRAVISTSVAICVFLALLVVVVALEWVPDALVTDHSPLASWRLLLVVMLLGMVGAYLSSATELRDRDRKLSIPDLRVGFTMLGMRPIVGALGATVVIVILQSALGEAVTLDSTAILGVAIVAGFTERLATRTVTNAANAVGG